MSSMNILSSQAVKKHFELFGWTCKEPEPLQNGMKVLRLHVSSNGERLRWRRGGDTQEFPPVITHQSTFSVCGKLVGHFPHMPLAQSCGGGYKMTMMKK